MMKIFAMVNILLSLLCISIVHAQGIEADLRARMENVSREHPRLFVTGDEWPALEARVMGDPLLKKTYEHILANANGFFDLPLLKREKTGRRLLGVSRTCLRRVSYLAMAYRMSGDKKYALRAQEEMLAVAHFSDWNPSHFLDVAEMTAALAIGYDWTYDALDPRSRDIIRDAIISKGLKASLKGGWWVSGENNWNQVCHGGLTLGALAVLEDEPELAHTIIARGIKNLPTAMHEYEPDGVYPEGPTYWKYGTSFNVVMIAALESVLDSHFGLLDAKGFKKSPYFYMHEVGSVGQFFNFADNGLNGGVSVSMHWFANKLNDPGLLWHEWTELEALVSTTPNPDSGSKRMLAFMLTWAQPRESVEAPKETFWSGNGDSPVVLTRSGWDTQDTFLAFKGGSPSTNHGHMDVGSFVLDMLGERWAIDLGPQSYHSLESKGIDLWNRKQDSGRWTVFRLNNHSHNTLSVNGQLQKVYGKAPIVEIESKGREPYAVIDMSEVYKGQLESVQRRFQRREDWVRIQDDLVNMDADTSVRWGMTTRAKVSIRDGGNWAIMEQGESQVALTVLSPEKIQLKVESAEKGPRDFDTTNPGVRRIVFDIPVKASASQRILVHIGTLDSSPSVESPSGLN